MIIDLILDRKAGKDYSPREFYNEVSQYEQNFPALMIANALDGGNDIAVRNRLAEYIRDNGYNENIINYIYSVNWL